MRILETPFLKEEKSVSAKNEIPPDRPRRESKTLTMLANVKCLECHCVGTIMNSEKGLVLHPRMVKKTLLEHKKGISGNLKKFEPTMKSAFEKGKDFVDGHFQGDRTSWKKKGRRFTDSFKKYPGSVDENRAWKRTTKTPKRQRPDLFTGWFSDEFEKDDFWKSKKRISLQ